MTIANLHARSGNTDKAIAEFRQIGKRFPNDENMQRGVQMGIAQIYIGEKSYDKAVAQLKKLLAQFKDKPTRAQTLSQLSRIYFERGSVEKAEQTYKILEEESGDDPAALFELHTGLGEIARRKGDDAEALTRYQKAFEIAPGDTQKIVALTAVAQIYSAQGKYDKAKQAYSQIEKEFNQSPNLINDAKFGQASVLQQNRRFDEAMALYKEVLATALDAATKSRADVAIAQIYAAQNKLVESEKAYGEILTKYGQNKAVVLDAKSGLASLYSSQGRLDEALKVQQEIESLTNDINLKISSISAQARIYSDIGNIDKAESLFKKIVSQSSKNSNAAFDAEMGLAGIALKRGQFDRAGNLYDNLFNKAADETQKIATLNALAQIHVQRKNYEDAEKVFRRMIDDYSRNIGTTIEAKLGLANVYKDWKKFDQAVQGYNEIITDYSDSMQSYWAYMGLAQIQSESGQIEQAIKTYGTISSKFPENRNAVADAKLNLANMLKNSNRRADALVAYDEIIKDYKNFNHALWAMQGKAQIYAEAADFQKAERVYDSIIQNKSATKDAVSDAKLGKAGLLATEGKVVQSIAAYKALVPDLTGEKALQAKMAVGHSYLAIQKLDEAQKQFSLIVQEYSTTNPNAVLDASLGLGELEMSRQKYAKAAQIFKSVAAKAKGEFSRTNAAYQALARSLVEQEKFDEVEPVIEKILKMNPDDANAIINIRMNMANKYRNMKKYDKAISQLDPVISKYQGHPQAAWAVHSKAQVLTEQQKYDQATAIYKTIIEKYPNNQTAIVDAKLNLAQIELYKRNKDMNTPTDLM